MNPTVLTPEVRARIARSVAEAPPLTDEQRRRLARLWAPAAQDDLRRRERKAVER